MNQPPATPDDDNSLQEELVAYLDGELDPAASARMEQRLAEDPAVRLQLQQLQRTWDMLDELPRAESGESFTQSTVELVALKAADDVQHLHAADRRKKVVIAGIALSLLVAAGLTGYLVARTAGELPNRQLLEDLPLVQQLDVYRHADNMEFVRMLEQRQLFVDEPLQPEEWVAADEPLEQRAQRLQAMGATEKEELQRKRERFEDLPVAQQQALRRLHATVSNDPQAERLQQVMVHYHNWLNTLPASQRAQILALPRPDRLDQVAAIIKEQEEQRFIQLTATKLQPAEIQALFSWFHEFVKNRQDELLASIPKEEQEKYWEKADGGKRSGWLYMEHREHNENIVLPSNEDIAALADQLTSKAARDALKGDMPQEEKMALVRGWMRATIMAKWRPEGVSEEELSRFYHETLESKEREYLESLPSERMREELERMYYFKERPRFRGPRRHGHHDERRDEQDGRRERGESRPPD